MTATFTSCPHSLHRIMLRVLLLACLLALRVAPAAANGGAELLDSASGCSCTRCDGVACCFAVGCGKSINICLNLTFEGLTPCSGGIRGGLDSLFFLIYLTFHCLQVLFLAFIFFFEDLKTCEWHTSVY